MDLLTHLPAPQNPVRVEKAVQGKDVRAEETGSMSFSGMLEQKQEQLAKPGKNHNNHQDQAQSDSKEPVTTSSSKGEVTPEASAKPAVNGSPLAGATTDNPGSINGQVMTNLMIRIQAGTMDQTQVQSQSVVQGSNLGSTPVKAPVANPIDATPGVVPTPEVAGVKPELLIDIQPTGNGSPLSATSPMLPNSVDSTNQPQITDTSIPAGKIQLESAPGTSLVKDTPVSNLNAETTKPVQLETASPITQSITGDLKTSTEPAVASIPVEGDEKEFTVETATTQASAAVSVNPEVDQILKNTKAEKTQPVSMASTEMAQSEISIEKLNLEYENQSSESESNVAQAAVEQLQNSENKSSTKPEQVAAEDLQLEVTTASENAKTSVVTPKVTSRTDALAQGRDIRQQVVRQLSTSLDGRIGNEKVTLILNPEKLGQVEIQLAAKGNELNIVMTTGTNEAEQAIREGIKELAEGIADKSGRFHHVDIKVEQRGQDQDKNDPRQDNRKEQSKQEKEQRQQQQNQHAKQDGAPDWASLQGEG